MTRNMTEQFGKESRKTDPNRALGRVAREVLIHAVGPHTGQSHGHMFTGTDYETMKTASEALADALLESGVARGRGEFMITMTDTTQGRGKTYRGQLQLRMPENMTQTEQRERFTAGYRWVASQTTRNGLHDQAEQAHARLRRREAVIAATQARLAPLLKNGT